MSDEKRKLKVPEVMLVSEILDRVNFKHYAEFLLTKIEKSLDADIEKLEIKAAMIIGDITAFILQNQCKAKLEIYQLIANFKGVKTDYIDNMTIDEYTETLRDIFQAGIPKILVSVMNNQDIVRMDDVKKKLNMMGNSKENNT